MILREETVTATLRPRRGQFFAAPSAKKRGQDSIFLVPPIGSHGFTRGGFKRMVCRRPTQRPDFNFHATELVVLSARKTALPLPRRKAIAYPGLPGLNAGACAHPGVNTDQILAIIAGQNTTELQMTDGHTRWVKDTPE